MDGWSAWSVAGGRPNFFALQTQTLSSPIWKVFRVQGIGRALLRLLNAVTVQDTPAQLYSGYFNAANQAPHSAAMSIQRTNTALDKHQP